MSRSVSIVVPMLDEAERLPQLLAELLPLTRQGVQVILADGGSRDCSAAIGRAAGFEVLDAPRGRARQMNAGAGASTGDVLLFLHADTRLPTNAIERIRQVLASPDTHWGRFDVRLDSNSWVLCMVSFLINRRSRMTGIATGDQAMFVRREVFESIGRFPEQPLMEDIELSRRLKTLSPPVCLRERAVTSARRWEQRGPWRTMLLMWRLRWAYWRGTSPETLAEAYR